MRASKEEAQKALERLDEIYMSTIGVSETLVLHVKEFVTAAKAKLPSEAAYDREKKRKPSKRKATSMNIGDGHIWSE